MSYQLWSWLLTFVGITGFIITGWLKQWWGWYVNIFCQILWILYAVFTQQWGFIASALIYTVIFGGSIVRHYRDARKSRVDIDPQLFEQHRREMQGYRDWVLAEARKGMVPQNLARQHLGLKPYPEDLIRKDKTDGNDTAISAVDYPTERILHAETTSPHFDPEVRARAFAAFAEYRVGYPAVPGSGVYTGHARHRATPSVGYTSKE